MKIKNKYLIVFLVAVLIQIILASVFFSISPKWPSGSSKEFRIELAESIASGSGFSFNSIPNLYQTPVYPFFLAVISATLGIHWWSIALFQSILGGISCVGISKIGNKFFKYGWLAGLIYAFYPYAAMQSRSIVDTPLYVLLFIWTIYFLLEFTETHKIKYLIWGSVLLGIGVLNRPSMIVIGPAFVFFIIAKKYSWEKILRYAFISGLIAGLIPFLWVVRNYHLTKSFPILTVGANHFMWYGHNEHIYEVLKNKESPDLIGIDPRYPMNPNFKVRDFFKINSVEQVQLSEKCGSIAKNWISQNKSEVVKYTFLKLKRFLSWEYGIKKQKVRFQSLRILMYRFTNAPITIFGWIGVLILFLKKRDISVFFIVIIIGFISIHIMTLSGSRHKIPLDALFITVIPLAIHYLYNKFLILKTQIVKA